MIEATLDNMIHDRQELRERLRFFDAGIWLGPPAGFPNAVEFQPAELGAALLGRGLTGGLVSHWWGKTVSAQDGNRVLAVALEGCAEDVYQIWTALPLQPGDDGPLPGVGDLPSQVRAVRLFPKAHNFSLADWCVGSLCEWLIERRMPLFIQHTETDWPSLQRLEAAFPALAIVVESQVQKILYHTRALFPLMQACSNVQVELSNFAGQGFVDYAVRQFGAERLIFGSFLPMNEPLVPIGMVLDADITEEEKALIAGGNLRRLVSEVRP
jgi:hypothetical protein